MALTAAETKELYQFFNVAFNAAPGVEYMNQLYEARQVMSMEQVVEVFTTKTQFTSIYPNFLTNETFASRLVDNVVGDSATAEAKASAAADIVAALALGWSRGKVIYTIFGNLANKETTDATWGTTATQFNNQVAVAQYYTETLLVNTTDTAKLQAVIANVTATTDVSTPAAIEAVVYSSGATTDVAGELSTTAGETVTGTPGNDTFAATLGVDLQDGDKILAGSGVDTLNIRAATGFAGIAQLQGLENVNINLRASSDLNLLLASGLDTVTITDESVAGRNIQITNAPEGTDYVINASGTTLSVGLEDAAGTGDVLNFDVNAGAATITLTGDDVETVNVDIATTGSGTLTLNADATTKLNVSGSVANGFNIQVNNSSSALNTEGVVGGVDVFATGAAASFTFSGGAGADTVYVALSTSDNLNGGAGSDTLVLSNVSGVSVSTSNVKGFETLTINPSSQVAGSVTVSNSGISTINVVSTSAAPDLNFVLENGGTINLRNTSADDYSFGATGGTTLTINQNSGITIDDVTVSGAQTVAFNAVSLAGNVVVDAFEAENGVENLSLKLTGSGALTVSSLLVSGVTGLTVDTGSNQGDAVTISNVTMKGYTNTFNTDLETVTAIANGSGNVMDFSAVLYAGSGLTAVTLTNNGDNTQTFEGVEIDEQGADLTVTLNLTGSGATTLGGAGNAINVSASGAVTLDVNMNGPDGVVNVSAIEAASTSSGTLSIDVVVSNSGSFQMATADTRTLDVTLVVGQDGAASAAALLGSGTAALDISIAGSGEAVIGNVSAGTLTSFSISGAAAASARIDAINLTSGGAGDINLFAGSGALITLTSIRTQTATTIGDITISGSGDVNIGAINAGSATVGNITIADTVSAMGATTISATTVGDITVGGDAVGLTFSSTNAIGTIALNGSAGSLTINNSDTFAVTVDSLTITGSGYTVVDVGQAAAVPNVVVDVPTTATAELRFASVQSAVEYQIDTGNVHIYVGYTAASVIDLTAGVGSARIYLQGTAASDSVTINDFQFGTDRIYLSSADNQLGFFGVSSLDAGVLNAVALVTAGQALVGTSSQAQSAQTNVIILATSTFADVSAALAYLGTYSWSTTPGGGVSATTLASAMSNQGAGASASFILGFNDDDGNAYVYQVHGSAGTSMFTGGAAGNVEIDLLATFEGQTITAGGTASFWV